MTLDDLNELRGVLERGFAGGFAAVEQLAAFTRQNAVQFQKDTPRLEIAVAIGNATGAKRGCADGTIRFSRWNFTVKFIVVTIPQGSPVRQDGESDVDFSARVAANNALHAEAVAAVRAYASTAAQSSWQDLVNFPNHFIAEALKDAGSPSALKSENGNEQTTLSFTQQVGIRETAWRALGL